MNSNVWQSYAIERDQLKVQLARQQRIDMVKLVGSADHADVVLVATDGVKMPAHLSIVEQRAPAFYARYVKPALSGKSKSVQLRDVNGDMLKCFLEAVYTRDVVDGETHDDSPLDDEPETSLDADLVEDAQIAADDDVDDMEPTDHEDVEVITESSSPAAAPTPTPEPQADSPTTPPLSVMDESHAISGCATEFNSQVDQQTILDAIADVERAKTPVMTSFRQLAMQTTPTALATEKTSHDVGVQDSPPNEEARTPEMVTIEFGCQTEPVELAPPSGNGNLSPDSVTQCSMTDDNASIQFVLSPMEQPSTPLQRHMSRDELFDTAISISRQGLTPSRPPSAAMSSIYQSPARQMWPQTSGYGTLPKRSVSVHRTVSDYASPQLTASHAGPQFSTFAERPPHAIVRPISQLDLTQPMIDELCGGPPPLRALNRRLSVASIRSIDSVGLDSPMTHTQVASDARNMAALGQLAPEEQETCSALAADLLDMYVAQRGTDVAINCGDGEVVRAHCAVLTARSAYFGSVLGKEWRAAGSRQVDMTSFAKESVHYMLCFMYGGVTSVSESLNLWELMTMTEMYQLEDMKQVLALHFKAKMCHFFHRPCTACVSTVLESLPRLHSFKLRALLDECLEWQARYFSRVWKSRAFNALSDAWQQKCFAAVVDNLGSDNVMNTLLGCEKLQMTLPRLAKGGLKAELVADVIATLLDSTLEHLGKNLDDVIVSEQFLSQGKGLALNCALLEDVLPSVIHGLSPKVGCRVLVRLFELLVFLTDVNEKQRSNRFADAGTHWNEVRLARRPHSLQRFTALIRRLYELCDTHLIHSAAQVIQCDSWHVLPEPMQARLRESERTDILSIHDAHIDGIFVEIRQPRAPPPRLSSLSRNYRRSASSVLTPGHAVELGSPMGRGRSLTRRPTVAIPELNEVTPRQSPPLTNRSPSVGKTVPQPKAPSRSRSRERRQQPVVAKTVAVVAPPAAPTKPRGAVPKSLPLKNTTRPSSPLKSQQTASTKTPLPKSQIKQPASKESSHPVASEATEVAAKQERRTQVVEPTTSVTQSRNDRPPRATAPKSSTARTDVKDGSSVAIHSATHSARSDEAPTTNKSEPPTSSRSTRSVADKTMQESEKIATAAARTTTTRPSSATTERRPPTAPASIKQPASARNATYMKDSPPSASPPAGKSINPNKTPPPASPTKAPSSRIKEGTFVKTAAPKSPLRTAKPPVNTSKVTASDPEAKRASLSEIRAKREAAAIKSGMRPPRVQKVSPSMKN